MSLPTAHELHRLGIGVLVDVRQPWETEHSPAPQGSVLVPLWSLKARTSPHLLTPEEIEDAHGFDLEAALGRLAEGYQLHGLALCICARGNRSVEATRILRDLGFARTYSVRSGCLGWETHAVAIDQDRQ
ncbi:MAG: rhodanese-like domain-containing protein [Acidiferrobacterales bacterium]